LRVGVRYDDAPFGIVTDRGDLEGFDIDLAREIAWRWLGDREAVDFVQVTDSVMEERIQNDLVDLIIGALPRNRSTAQHIDFSVPYYYEGLTLLLSSSEATTDTTAINGPAALGDVAVAVVEDSDTEAPLLRVSGQAQPHIVYYPDYFSAVAGLKNRIVEAVVGPRRKLERVSVGDTGLRLAPDFMPIPYVIGLPKKDGAFRDLTNATLMRMIEDGTLASLYAEWFPNQPWPQLETWSGTSRLQFQNLGDRLDPVPDTIQQIRTRGHLLAGLVDDQLPFSDLDANGVAQGFEPGLVRALTGRWLGDLAAVQFVVHTEESGLAALQTGQIDLLVAPLPHTLPLEDDIDFSVTVYQGGSGFLVGAESGINNLSALNGATVAVPADGIIADQIQRAALEASIVLSLESVPDTATALAGVAEGRYRAYADWRTDLLNLAYANAGFIVLDDRLTHRPIALGLRQNDAAFRDLVDFTLQAMAAEGGYAALYDDWFGTDPPLQLEIWLGAPYRPLDLTVSSDVVPTVEP
jgi:polar amino acid transport system substrate-binding protein